MNYGTVADGKSIERVIGALAERSVMAEAVASRAEALARVKTLIPIGASITNGASRTLEEIGYIDYLKSGAHGWNNLHEKILAETDPQKRAALRKATIVSDYYLGSVHALAMTGEFVVASASGSQLAPIVFTAQNLIFVVGAQKIVPTLADALDRVEAHVFPLEDARMKSTGAAGSVLAKELIFRREPAYTGRKVRMIIVKEKLGF